MRKLLAILMTLPLFKAAAADLHVFATASLPDALKEIAAGFEKESAMHATLNLGGSSLLAWQIEKGASTDVFVSAEAKMDELQKNGFIVVATDKADFAFAYKTEAAHFKTDALDLHRPGKRNARNSLSRHDLAGNKTARRGGAIPQVFRFFRRARLLRALRLRCAALMWLAPDEWQAARFTLLACALSTTLILPFGLGLAWLLSRPRWFGKSIVETLVTLPLVMPPVATGLILLKLLGRRGPLGGWLHRHFDFDIVFTWRAVVIAAAVMSFPLLVRSARVGFQEVNRRYEEMARTLGAGEWRVFATVSLPLAARAILGGVLLAFARAVGEFGATILVAGNIPGETTTLSLRIYEAVQLGHDAVAYRLLVVCIVIAFVAVFAGEWLLRKRETR